MFRCRGGYYPPDKGTPSLAGRPLSKNNSLDCFSIHPLRGAFGSWALPKPARGAASGLRLRNTSLRNPVHILNKLIINSNMQKLRLRGVLGRNKPERGGSGLYFYELCSEYREGNGSQPMKPAIFILHPFQGACRYRATHSCLAHICSQDQNSL